MFDVLELAGEELASRPLADRRQALLAGRAGDCGGCAVDEDWQLILDAAGVPTEVERVLSEPVDRFDAPLCRTPARSSPRSTEVQGFPADASCPAVMSSFLADSDLQEVAVRTAEIDAPVPSEWIERGPIGRVLGVVAKANPTLAPPIDDRGEVRLTA